jgi:hypothetical protein
LAYDELKTWNIYAILKGYYVKSVEFVFEQRIFLLFDELNKFPKKIFIIGKLYNEWTMLPKLDFHHFNIDMFRKLINESNGNYSKYIMPTNLLPLPIIKILSKK